MLFVLSYIIYIRIFNTLVLYVNTHITLSVPQLNSEGHTVNHHRVFVAGGLFPFNYRTHRNNNRKYKTPLETEYPKKSSSIKEILWTTEGDCQQRRTTISRNSMGHLLGQFYLAPRIVSMGTRWVMTKWPSMLWYWVSNVAPEVHWITQRIKSTDIST